MAIKVEIHMGRHWKVGIAGISFIIVALLTSCTGMIGDVGGPRGAWTVGPKLACPGDQLEFSWVELQNTTEAKIEPDIGLVSLSSLSQTATFNQTTTYVFEATDGQFTVNLPTIESVEANALNPDVELVHEIEVANADEVPRQTISVPGRKLEERDDDWPGLWVCRWETTVPSSAASDQVIMISIRNEMGFDLAVSKPDVGLNHEFLPFPDQIAIDSHPNLLTDDLGQPLEYSGVWTFTPSNNGLNAFFTALQEQIDSGDLTDCEGFIIEISVDVACR